MSDTTCRDEELETIIENALATAINRNDSQAVIDTLTLAVEYMNGGGEYNVRPDNIPDEVLPSDY